MATLQAAESHCHNVTGAVATKAAGRPIPPRYRGMANLRDMQGLLPIPRTKPESYCQYISPISTVNIGGAAFLLQQLLCISKNSDIVA